MSEDPADAAHRLAMRGHGALAVFAAPALGDRRDQHPVAHRKPLDRVADRGDRADGLVAEDPAVGHRRHIALQDVQIGAADGRGVDAYDDVGGSLDSRISVVFPALMTGTVINECLHEILRPETTPDVVARGESPQDVTLRKSSRQDVPL